MQLSALQHTDGTYVVLDLSSVHELADGLGLELTGATEQAIVTQMLEYCTVTLSPLVSGLILGPEVGFTAIQNKAPDTGLALSLYQQIEQPSVLELPKVFPDWSVTHIRNNYGVLFDSIFYHPKGADALQKKQLVAELHDATRYEGIDHIVSINLYPPEGEETTQTAFQESQLLAIKELQTCADVLVLEYPHSALACATLTAELDIPWLVVDKATDYAYTKDTIRTAIESGAQGCVLTTSLWAGLPQFDVSADPAEQWNAIDRFLQTEVRDRLLELTRIISEYRAKESVE